MKTTGKGLGFAAVLLCAALTAQANPPDRQGGDTCENALPLPEIPCVVSGTTVGRANDYDEVCPYQGSTAPDVVYSYTAYYNTLAYLTLCLDVTDYDSKLYVYEDECIPGTAIACNDDACSSPNYPNYVSEIPYVWFYEGHTYYIVVDGYNANSAGNYQLTIDEIMFPPPPECPYPETFYGQRAHAPEESWHAYLSDTWSGTTTYDNLVGIAGSVYGLSWWGLDLRWDDGWNECDLNDPTPFIIQFYPDVGGAPDYQYPLYTYHVEATRTLESIYGDYEVWYFEAYLSPDWPVGPSWVSIQGDAQTGCEFMWLTSPEGDGLSYQWVPGDPPDPGDVDFAFCLLGTPSPIGACCDDSTGECTDWVYFGDCTGPDTRSVMWTLCDELDPPCGTGGCCFGYRCSDTPLHEEDCLAAGGEFLGYGVSCTDALCDCGGTDYRGDANCAGDGVNSYDIDGFIMAVGSPGSWIATYGETCNYYCANDINCDGGVNSYDIDGFIMCVGQDICDPCP